MSLEEHFAAVAKFHLPSSEHEGDVDQHVMLRRRLCGKPSPPPSFTWAREATERRRRRTAAAAAAGQRPADADAEKTTTNVPEDVSTSQTTLLGEEELKTFSSFSASDSKCVLRTSSETAKRAAAALPDSDLPDQVNRWLETEALAYCGGEEDEDCSKSENDPGADGCSLHQPKPPHPPDKDETESSSSKSSYSRLRRRRTSWSAASSSEPWRSSPSSSFIVVCRIAAILVTMCSFLVVPGDAKSECNTLFLLFTHVIY